MRRCAQGNSVALSSLPLNDPVRKSQNVVEPGNKENILRRIANHLHIKIKKFSNTIENVLLKNF